MGSLFIGMDGLDERDVTGVEGKGTVWRGLFRPDVIVGEGVVAVDWCVVERVGNAVDTWLGL